MSNITYILYDTGAGGNWLSSVIYALETQHNERMLVPPVNFHDKLTYPNTPSLYFLHTPMFQRNLVDFTTGCFHGFRTNFIVYINEYVKLYQTSGRGFLHPDTYAIRINSSLSEQLFYHSNTALWRIDGSADREYGQNIKFDLDLVFTDPEKFIQQLYQTLNEYDINFTPNDEFVRSAIDVFIQTCKYKQHVGFVDSIAWQGWCHALCLYHNIEIPVSISNDYHGFINFIRNNNQQFIDLTRKNNII